MDKINEKLAFDSLDQLQIFMKNVYESKGISGVKNWVINNFTKGRELFLKEGPSGKLNQKIQICDRRMEILDKNGINVIDYNYLSFIAEPINYEICDLYFSLRILFIDMPFGIVIYRKR